MTPGVRDVAQIRLDNALLPTRGYTAQLELGAGLTTWVTFAPCFGWIFAFAPWIDRLAQATGPSVFILPAQGGNEWDRPGAPLHVRPRVELAADPQQLFVDIL